MSIPNVVQIKRSLADDMRTEVTTIAENASEKDRSAVDKLVKKAKTASYSAEIVTLTPSMCALLFLFHNNHNRSWNASWTVELSRRMKAGLWKVNSMTAGFYADGKLEDGQHRLAAAAIADMTWKVVIVFGVDKDSIDTVDGNRRRTGADHALLDGISDPTKKQAIIKNAANYFVRAGNEKAALRSESEVKSAIETNDNLLIQAIEIGVASRENLAGPQLKETVASSIAYVMMKSNWPTQNIREKLAYFQQSGGSTLGENDPYFVAVSILAKARESKAKTERMTLAKEMGIVILALVEAEKGTKAIHKKRFMEATKKAVPDPRYPNPAAQEAAA